MHIYERTNNSIESRHYVEMSTRPGELRPTRITDFRKWIKEGRSVAPSVTTILDIYSKPALTNWKIDQHLKLAYRGDVDWALDDKSEADYIKEIKRLAEIEMDRAPSAGTDFHKDMEKAIIDYQSGAMPKDLELKVIELIQEKTDCKSLSYWNSEINVFSDLGYAGQCDLFIEPVFDSGHQYQEAWIIDYKTKQTADKFKPGKMAFWDSHLAQLMAYGMELDPSGMFNCANVFVCLETGEIDFHVWDDESLKTKAWEYFQCALEAWNIKNL